MGSRVKTCVCQGATYESLLVCLEWVCIIALHPFGIALVATCIRHKGGAHCLQPSAGARHLVASYDSLLVSMFFFWRVSSVAALRRGEAGGIIILRRQDAEQSQETSSKCGGGACAEGAIGAAAGGGRVRRLGGSANSFQSCHSVQSVQFRMWSLWAAPLPTTTAALPPVHISSSGGWYAALLGTCRTGHVKSSLEVACKSRSRF